MYKPCIDCVRMQHSDKTNCEFKSNCDWLHWYQQGKTDGVKEFIEWLQEKSVDNTIALNYGKFKHMENEEVLDMWQKEVE